MAIVSAFLTTKVLSIASEIRSLRNRLSILQAELDHDNDEVKALNEQTDEYERKWADEDTTSFIAEAVRKATPSRPPSLDELLTAYEKEHERLNGFEASSLKEKYPEFVAAVNSKPPASRFVFPADFGAALGPLLFNKRSRERAVWKELSVKSEKISDRVDLEELRKNELTQQISSISLPRYLKFGFGVLA